MTNPGAVRKAEPLTECPFCKSALAVTFDDDGAPDGVIHADPLCRRFVDSEDALAFIIDVRREMERRTGTTSRDH